MASPSASGPTSPTTPQVSQTPSAAQSPFKTAAGQMQDATRMSTATEIALRGEVKRLREENMDLRRRHAHVKALEEEVQFLKTGYRLEQEEKVPIRLRELENENLRLRKQLAMLQEKLKTLESDEYRQRLMDHHAFFSTIAQQQFQSSWGSPAPSASPGRKGGTASPATGGASADQGSATKNKPSFSMASGPCERCSVRILAVERAAEADKKELQQTIATLTAELTTAKNELDEIHQFVQKWVSIGQQYPNALAQQAHLFVPGLGANPAVNAIHSSLDTNRPASSSSPQYWGFNSSLAQ